MVFIRFKRKWIGWNLSRRFHLLKHIYYTITSTTKGQVIKGDMKCSGCIVSSKVDVTDLKVVTGDRHKNTSAKKTHPYLTPPFNANFLLRFSLAEEW